MKISYLYDLPPWELPEDIQDILHLALNDPATDLTEKHLAVELAGDTGFLQPPLAKTLLKIISDNSQNEELRATAVISLGPTMEMSTLDEFDDPYFEDFSMESYQYIKDKLDQLYPDHSLPELIRRMVLEVSVRDPQEWHTNAVRESYDHPNRLWRLTAVFCMGYIDGFDSLIVESLKDSFEDIRYQAIIAAGAREIKESWPIISELYYSQNQENKDLLFAIIDAAVGINTIEARYFVSECLSSEDQDIVDAAHEALAMMIPDDQLYAYHYAEDNGQTH